MEGWMDEQQAGLQEGIVFFLPGGSGGMAVNSYF